MTTTGTRRRPPPTRGKVAHWAARIGLAAVFAAAGLAKLGGDAAMVELFDDIGAGQGLRLFVGALELAGAVGLLVRRLHRAAAVGLALLMVGATVTNVAVLHTSPVLTVALGLAAAGVAWARPGQRGQS
nr:DoxX family protein [Modestobacter marinus]